jgi:hypothetical protein
MPNYYADSSNQDGWPTIPVKSIARYLVLAVVFLVVWNVVLPNFGYFWNSVRSNEVGIKFQAGRPYEVVGPGRYTALGLFEAIQTIKIEGLPFTASDDEVLTADKQRIGVAVSGTVHRPGVEKAKVLLDNWTSYRTFYTNDDALVGATVKTGDKTAFTPGLMQQLSLQAMKVCVGDLTFDKAVIGAARDTLRECVDKELDRLSASYGLEVRNIVVPNIVLSGAVQKQLDQITESRFASEVANQQRLQASAEADRTLAAQQGAIRVEQGKIQEKAKQDATTAQLQQDAAVAQAKANEAAALAEAKVIQAKKENERLTAERDLQIAEINRKVQEQNALAGLAPKTAEAQIVQSNPRFAELEATKALAAAYKQTDKVIIDSDTKPLTVLNGSGGSAPSVIVGGR